MFRLVLTINVGFLHTKHNFKLVFHLSYSKQYDYYFFFRMMYYYTRALKSVISNFTLAAHSPKFGQAKTHSLSHFWEKRKKYG